MTSVSGVAVQWLDACLIVSSLLPAVWLLFSLTYARGNGQEILSRWRIPLGIALLAPFGIGVVFSSHLILAVATTRSQPQWNVALGLPSVALILILLISSVMIVMNLERTYRAAIGTMRWRIKFMVLGVGTLFVVRAYTCVQNLVFHAIVPPLQNLNAIGLIVAGFLILRSLLRAGNFDVTVYPSQAILRSSITIFIAGIYLLVVGVLAKFASLFGGSEAVAFPEKAFCLLVGLVLLGMLLLSDRFRLYTKLFVSRHFQRPLHDYRAVWRHFTEATTSRLNQVDLCRAAVRLIADQFQALSVTIWVFDEQKQNLTFAASTFLIDSKGEEVAPRGRDALEVVHAVRTCPQPTSIEQLSEHWAEVLRNCHPNQFPGEANRVCVPMFNGGEIIGVLTLGDRVGSAPFVQQDFDLLNCLGDHLAANLRNLQLSRKLLENRELEAFQSMSAFFVHDLKNTASTLGLMLQNLPVHFNDPNFREDALRGISRTVEHINQLISRLGVLRQGLVINPVEADLNALLAKLLANMPPRPGIEIVQNLGTLSRFHFDAEQVAKVFTNLLLNACEAVGKNGVIRVETCQQDKWAVLRVSDTGCGMSADFLNKSLFRPFQTTKKNGLGIGMFQSKMLIEAHGGRLDVESELGKGSRFTVFLPFPKRNA